MVGDIDSKESDFYMEYEPGEILGDGISSVVRRCIHKETGKYYAVKIIDKFSKDGQAVKGLDVITQVRAEVKALSKLRLHPAIITLKDFYETSAFLFLVFDIATGGELFDYLTREVTLSEKTSRRIMWQLLHALHYVHTNDLVHRDIKPENILLDDENNIILSDFGFAISIKDGESLFEVLGTPSYFAPETLKCVVYDGAEGYGKPVDMWACGVILYTLLVGQGPFWHRRDTIMYRKIMEGKYVFGSPEWDDISEGPKDLIRRLLVVETSKRFTASEALAHPWFKGMMEDEKCCILDDDTQKKAVKVKLKLSLKTLVYTILTLKKLYFNYHEQYVPMTYKTVLAEPYTFKNIRKIVDSCAFNVYGHWVKRTPSHAQNRETLFENVLKSDLMNSGYSEDTMVEIPDMYSHKLTLPLTPRTSQFSKLGNAKEKISLFELAT